VRPRPKLRVIARSEVLPRSVAEQASRDLGFDIEFSLIDSVRGLQRVVTRPDTFDVYHQWHTVDLIWTARSIQPIDLNRIATGPLIKSKVLAPLGSSGSMGSQYNQVYLQPTGQPGRLPTDQVLMLPLLHGGDAFGYLPAVGEIWPEGTPHSWGWLFDPQLHGRVGMMNEPVLGMIEAALAVEASEGVSFADIGNLSIEEIDLIAGVLLHKKRLGHFKSIWSNYEEAARAMQRGVVLQSMFSPATALLRAQGVPVKISVPEEGYRGWHVDLCLSAAAEGERLEAAYAYLNWWMNGWGGAMLARQGYYFVLPEMARQHLSAAEWDYWYAGRPASEPLRNQFGDLAIPEGDLREGGSHSERMSRVRVWNTFMDEHNYLVRRWNEFLSA